MEEIKGTNDVIIPDFDKREESEEMIDKTKLLGYATPDQVEAWKKQYGGLIVEAIVGNKIAYFKKASRMTLRAALSFIEKDKLKYLEVILVNCFVGGDKSVLDDDDEFYGLAEVAAILTEGKQAKIKKY